MRRIMRHHSACMLALAVALAGPALAQNVQTQTLDASGSWTASGITPSPDGIVLAQPIANSPHQPVAMARQDGAGAVMLQTDAYPTAAASQRLHLIGLDQTLAEAGVPAEFGSVEMGDGMRWVNTQGAFTQPVPFTALATTRGGEPAFTYITEAWGADFAIGLAETPSVDGAHMVETVRYVAIEPGTYPLADGRILTVGWTEMADGMPVDRGWEQYTGTVQDQPDWIRLPIPLKAGAAVATTLVADYDQNPAALDVSPWQQDGHVTAIRILRRSFGPQGFKPRRVGYMAIGEPVDPAERVQWKTPVRTARLDGVTDAWIDDGLAGVEDGFALAQPIVGGPGAAPIVRYDDDRLKLQSDVYQAPVAAGRVDVLALGGGLRGLGVPFEIGRVEVSHDGAAVEFDTDFQQTPAVFARVATHAGWEPASVWSQLYEGGAFFMVRESASVDGWHAVETVEYLAIEPGRYDLPDGRSLVVGETYVNGYQGPTSIYPGYGFAGEPVVVGSLAEATGDGFARTGIEKVDYYGTVNHVRVHVPYGVGGRFAYMMVGEVAHRPSVEIRDAYGASASIEVGFEDNGRCFNVDDYGLRDLERAILEFDRDVVVAAFDGRSCAGKRVELDSRWHDNGDMWVRPSMQQEWGWQTRARSFRIAQTRDAAENRDAGCYGPGEAVVGNGLAQFGLSPDGVLGLHWRDHASGRLLTMWSAGVQADAVCLEGEVDPYDYYSGMQIVATRGGQEVWRQDLGRSGLSMGRNCQVGSQGWSLDRGMETCVSRVPMAHQALPGIKVIYGDIDGDADPEMVLMVTKDDGSGWLITDPLGVASFLYTLGLPIDAGFIDALSQTQRDTLVWQTEDVIPGGVQTIEQLLQVLDGLRASQPPAGAEPDLSQAFAQAYAALAFEAHADGSLAEADARAGDFEASVAVGDYEFDWDIDENGQGGYEARITAVKVEATYGGYATVEVEVGSAGGKAYMYDDGFVVGGGADAVAVTFRGGREDRSHVGVSAGVGVGFEVGGSWGRDDMYGFTLDLPIFPIGVSIYVKGSEAVWLGNRIAALAETAYDETVDFGTMAWGETQDWVLGAADDTQVFFTDAANDTKIFVERTADGVTVAVESGYNASTVWLDGAVQDIGATLDTTMNAIGGALEDGVDAAEAVVNDVADWTNTAINDVESAGNTVINWFSGLF